MACSEGSSGEMLSAVLKSEKPSSALTDLKSANPSPVSKREGRERERERNCWFIKNIDHRGEEGKHNSVLFTGPLGKGDDRNA